MTNEDAIRILSVLHLGYPLQVKEACEMGIKALMKQTAETKDANAKKTS